MDLRVRRTRRLLWEALLSLLDERAFDALTVDEICRRAMVHRTTFYKHYRDKNDLAVRGAESTLESLADRLERSADETVEQAARGVVPEHVMVLLEHVAAEPAFYRLAFRGDPSLPFRPILEKLLARGAMGRFAVLTRDSGGPVPDEVISVYGTGALLSVVSWWIAGGLRLPAETVAEYVTVLMTHGTHAAAGKM